MEIRADVYRVGRVNGAATLLDMLNLAVLVHDKGGAAGKLSVFVQDTVCLGDFALHVAQEREFHADFLGKRVVGRGSINADAKYRGVIEVDLAGVDTRLVSLKLLRSTTGEGEYVKRQDDRLLAAVIAQLYRRTLVAAQREIGREVSDLKKGVGELGLLRPSSRRGKNPGKKYSQQERCDSFRHRSSFVCC
jgi:hypothetical protein